MVNTFRDLLHLVYMSPLFPFQIYVVDSLHEKPFQKDSTRPVLCVYSGICLSKSLSKKATNPRREKNNRSAKAAVIKIGQKHLMSVVKV